MPAPIFTEDARMTPYWWDRAPPGGQTTGILPGRVDTLVVGSGYTGLHAALQIARHGRDVVVCDAQEIGWGCSTRNGGQVSTSVKPGLEELTRRHGPEIARQIYQDGRDSLIWLEDFIRHEGIDCDFNVVGRFHAAHNATEFRKLTDSALNQPAGFEVPVHIVPRSEQHRELGSDAYHGGVVFEKHASLDPGRYHAGLVDLARAAGVRLAPHTPVTDIARAGLGFEVETSGGRIEARTVVIATNAYSGPLSRWHRRRIIPIGSYIIATEELPDSLMDVLIPNNRIVSDTCRVLSYFRASPDRRRILYGGRVSVTETDPRRSAPLLRQKMLEVFPQLRDVRISHSWGGFVGYTFDELAHAGEDDGLHYAMGYCGSGVGLASYLGMRTGQRVLGLRDGETGFHKTRFPTRPYYTGKPWFLAPAIHWYRLRDRMNF